MERVVQSIGQDCIYAVSRGNVNHPGHGISYSKLEETDTALSLQKQRQEADQGIVLPSSCHPHIPTSLAFDNIDRLEETLSGGGTSHRVNGVIIRPQVHTVKPPETAPQILANKKAQCYSNSTRYS